MGHLVIKLQKVLACLPIRLVVLVCIKHLHLTSLYKGKDRRYLFINCH